MKLSIAQVSRIMGGALVKDGPPRPGNEAFIRPLNNNGQKYYLLLVGVYKVLFTLEGSLDGTQNYVLDQSDLMNIGCTLTIGLYPLMGVLEVHNDQVLIEEGAPLARLVPLPEPVIHIHNYAGDTANQ